MSAINEIINKVSCYQAVFAGFRPYDLYYDLYKSGSTSTLSSVKVFCFGLDKC